MHKEKRNAYEFNVAVLKRYGDRYKVTYNRSIRAKGVSLEARPRGVNDKKTDSNIRRAKNKIKEYALCNDWDYFVTLTVNKDKLDRYDIKGYIKKLGQYIADCNRNRDNKITYLLIPEQHKDGAWHMHGFINGLTDNDVIFAKIRNERKVFHWMGYSERFGFNDMELIEDKEKASSYITKYVSKDMSRSVSEINAKMYYCSKGLLMAEKIKKGTVSAKYVPTYEKIIDNEVVYSEMWLPRNTTEQQATSFIHNSTEVVWKSSFEMVADEETGEILRDIPLEWI